MTAVTTKWPEYLSRPVIWSCQRPRQRPFVAGAIGCAVGWLNFVVRARMEITIVTTVISFTVPFIAAIPADEVGVAGPGLWV